MPGLAAVVATIHGFLQCLLSFFLFFSHEDHSCRVTRMCGWFLGTSALTRCFSSNAVDRTADEAGPARRPNTMPPSVVMRLWRHPANERRTAERSRSRMSAAPSSRGIGQLDTPRLRDEEPAYRAPSRQLRMRTSHCMTQSTLRHCRQSVSRIGLKSHILRRPNSEPRPK
jgi:hypothetical protein